MLSKIHANDAVKLENEIFAMVYFPTLTIAKIFHFNLQSRSIKANEKKNHQNQEVWHLRDRLNLPQNGKKYLYAEILVYTRGSQTFSLKGQMGLQWNLKGPEWTGDFPKITNVREAHITSAEREVPCSRGPGPA